MGASGSSHDEWAKGELYEPYVGRWSRAVAVQFLQWLSVPAQAAWLDVGCGTGSLSVMLAGLGYHVTGIDLSPAMLARAEAKAAAFGAMRPLDPSDIVRGQFNGYRQEDGVAPHSTDNSPRPSFLRACHPIV